MARTCCPPETLKPGRRDAGRLALYDAPGSDGAGRRRAPPRAAHSGRFGLRLCVTPADPKRVPAALEIPPIVFTSPAMQVTAGQVVCIHGWARVPGPVPAGSDGLLIIDSLGGEPLAERIGQTEKWRPFVLYRAAPQSGPMWITFALSAVGEAWLDDVGVETLELPAAG